jgi:hypothetical protein
MFVCNLVRNSVLPATLDSSCGENHEGNAAMLAAFIGDPHSDISSCGFAHVKFQCFEGTLKMEAAYCYETLEVIYTAVYCKRP